MENRIEPRQNRPVQLAKARKNGWTKTRRAAFLAELAQSCNVARAHAAAGMGRGSAYLLRRRDPEFAAQWQQALEAGYERLEMALLRRAREAVGDLVLDEDAEPVGRMTVTQAIDFMGKHRASVARGGARKRRPPPREVATQEETDAALLKRIEMVERQRARSGVPGAGTQGGVST